MKKPNHAILLVVRTAVKGVQSSTTRQPPFSTLLIAAETRTPQAAAHHHFPIACLLLSIFCLCLKVDKLLVGKRAFAEFSSALFRSALALPPSFHPCNTTDEDGWQTAYLILPPQW